MHQISLLGGLGQTRHGGGSHFLRPDRVYRTGVLAPMTGFRPGPDVQAIAADFTQGPQSGTVLSGAYYAGGPFAGLGQGGAFGKLRAWWQGVKARARAGKMLPLPAAAAQTPSVASEPVVSLTPGPYGAEPNAAFAVGPFARGLPGALVAASYGQSPFLSPFARESIDKTTMMHWQARRWPWR